MDKTPSPRLFFFATPRAAAAFRLLSLFPYPSALSRSHSLSLALSLSRSLSLSLSRPPNQLSQVKWYAVVANAQFMLHDVQNEAFPEQLRERKRLFGDKGKELDFFLVCEPAWLDGDFAAEAKRIGRPAVALISTDATWITFMKLRLDRVLRLDPPREMAPEEALRCGAAVPDFVPLDRSPEAGRWTAPYSPYKPGWWNVFLGSENGFA